MIKFEIATYSLNEAKEMARVQGLNVVKNVTMSYNRFDGEFDDFAEDILKKNKIDPSSNDGCIVVLEPGSADTRERPYEFINYHAEGSLTKKRMFEVRTKDSGKLVATAETKAEAARQAKAVMKDVREDLVCRQVYHVLGEHEIPFELKYTPSANTKTGKYIVFGYNTTISL